MSGSSRATPRAARPAGTCVNFVSNLIDGYPALSFTDYFVEMYTGTTFRIQGLAGSGTDAVNVGNFISSTDDDPAAGDPVVDAGSGTTVNYTNAVVRNAVMLETLPGGARRLFATRG